jgi:hypothetical protein
MVRVFIVCGSWRAWAKFAQAMAPLQLASDKMDVMKASREGHQLQPWRA